MDRKASVRTGGMMAGLALAGLGLLAVTEGLAPTAEAQAPSTPSPRVVQQTRERVQTPAGQSSTAQPRQPQRPQQGGPRRDPFRSLVVRADEITRNIPNLPGKRGLVIRHITVDGLVITPTGLIAVATMTGRNRAYFLREGDELYDGYVSQITPDGVVFKQRTSDAFGREYEREVVKSISAPGAQR